MATESTGETSNDPRGITPRDATTGRLLILAAAILWSSSGFFGKHSAFADWPADSRGLLMAFWRALFGGLVILPLVRRPRLRRRLIPMTLSFALMNASYLSAFTLTTAANAIWLQNTAPIWVLLIGALALGDPVRRQDLVLLLFGMVGVGVIVACEIRGQQQAGIMLGLLAGFSYGLVVMFIRAQRDEDPAWLTALNLLVTAALLAPYLFYRGIWPTPQQTVILAAFGLVQMGLPYVLLARGLRTVPSAEAMGIGLVEPILVPIWAYLAWHDEPQWWTLLGAALILTGLAIRYLPATFRMRAE